MTKDEIISKICRETWLSRNTVEGVVDTLSDTVIEALSRGKKVQITGFGTFEPKKRAARIGRNPHTGEAVPIPARVIPSFKPSKKFTEAVICNFDK